MFTKLLKYDIRAVFKYWWIVALSSLPIAILAGICLHTIINGSLANKMDESIQAFAIMGLFFTVMGIVFIPLLTSILIFVRFYKNFFTDEGYLTFTLPVKKTTLLNSKLTMAVLFSVLSTLLVVFDVFLLVVLGIPNELFTPETWTDFASIFAELFQEIGFYGVIYSIQYICLSIIGVAIQMLFIFICITCGAIIAKKHKILCSIAIYYGANMLVSFVMQILSLSGMFTLISYLETLDATAFPFAIIFLLFIALGILLIMASGLYLLELRLLDKHLNLE